MKLFQFIALKKLKQWQRKKIIRFLEMPITYSTTSTCITAYEIRSYYIKMRYMYKDWHARTRIRMHTNLWYMIMHSTVSFHLLNILNIKYSSFLSMSVSHQEIWIQIVLNEKCKIWPSWYDSWKDKIRFFYVISWKYSKIRLN